MPEKKVLKLALGLPAYGAKIAMWQQDMWLQLGYALGAAAHRFQLVATPKVDVCGIDVARNRLVEEAIMADCDWLFLVDADTWHDEDGAGYDILQMISDAERLGATIIAPPVPRRDPANTQYMVYDQFPKAMDPRDYWGKVVTVDVVATAMCAINVQRAKTLPQPWFKFDYVDGTLKFLGEDAYFCRKVQQAGGKVLVDGRFSAKHLQRPEILTGTPPTTPPVG